MSEHAVRAVVREQYHTLRNSDAVTNSDQPWLRTEVFYGSENVALLPNTHAKMTEIGRAVATIHAKAEHNMAQFGPHGSKKMAYPTRVIMLPRHDGCMINGRLFTSIGSLDNGPCVSPYVNAGIITWRRIMFEY